MSIASMTNKVQLIGRLGADPEIKEYNGGKKLAKFSLVTLEPGKGESGEREMKNQWHNIVVWGKNAENVQRTLQKGTRILLEGKICYADYIGKDGQKKFVTEIELHQFLVLEKETSAQ